MSDLKMSAPLLHINMPLAHKFRAIILVNVTEYNLRHHSEKEDDKFHCYIIFIAVAARHACWAGMRLLPCCLHAQIVNAGQCLGLSVFSTTFFPYNLGQITHPTLQMPTDTPGQLFHFLH